MNDMLRFENENGPRLAILVSGGALDEEQVRAVAEWLKAHPETGGHLELSGSQALGLSPTGLVALLDRRFGT